ncbi:MULTISPECIES: AAA family ATPase [Ralstonia]|jgi:cobaltochelatase CobS|uniref:Aerobic cobaltochelatase subunit CobS n=3 Tax=Pseudomonadota TaxID=1224 RepID=A0AAD2BRN9_9RALS|nr:MULTISPECIES: AAA family ATPase [Ralstonia]NOZ17918.1 AAA family ATPase [Betaproteobacteria bacterium]MBA9871371.1 AAA family ATPase [Ralstonia insidiosa]MBA9915625.1 AAA family ATPase [Ralstonia insidiosa]MBA9954616.1 AAA family ATPase [Ralstonia insidiosa]MBA9971128.1 AAA family ATPase [Ralstonia insidiosa]
MSNTIENLFGIPGASAPIQVRERIDGIPAQAYPAVSAGYVFQLLLLKKLLRFLLGNPARRNAMLIGEPGVGKTSIVNEIASRLNIPVFSLACSGKTRFSHMVGGYEIVGGNTQWRDGPLVMAMRHGGIFLANEITRLDSGEQMNLAEVLDSRASITIPDTGEVVMADPNFRFIATGNSGGYGDDSGVYQGERISSVAFLDRFQVFKVGHMDATDEQALLQKLAPSLPVAIVEGMVKLAGEVRKNFVGRGGTLRVIMSTRSLCVWAMETVGYSKISGIVDSAREALLDTSLNGAPEDEASAVLEIWDRWVKEGA